MQHKLRERAGSCHLNKGDMAKAEEEFRVALELLGSVEHQQGDAKQKKVAQQWKKGLEEKLAKVEAGKKAVALAQKGNNINQCAIF